MQKPVKMALSFAAPKTAARGLAKLPARPVPAFRARSVVVRAEQQKVHTC